MCARGVGEVGGGQLVGLATVSLRQLLSEGADLLRAELPIVDGAGQVVGALGASVLLKQLAYTLFGARSWRREAVEVAQLVERAARPA